MISINETLLVQMVNVLVLVFLMNMILYRPIRRIVTQRKQFIQEQESAIKQADSEAMTIVEEFNARIREARQAGRQKIQEIKNAAHEYEKSLLQQAMDGASRQLAEMRARIGQDIGSAREELKKQVKALSIDLAQKILGRSL